MRTTIKDVAKKANVSTATVSLVVHGHNRISPETKNRVEKAIKALNYYPSKSARNLVSRKTGNIGFILTEDHFLKTEPFYTQIFLGTEFEARNQEYYILLTTIPTNFSKDDDLPRFILERSIDGLIIAGKVPDLFIEKIEPFNLPIVMVDYYTDHNAQSAVLIDNIGGAQQATEYLLSLGHKNIAFIGGDLEHPSISDRYHGFKMALEKNKKALNENLIVLTENATSREDGYHAAKFLHQSQTDFSAVFACNDAMAIGAMQYFKSTGIRIPQDLSIIGFDNIEGDLYQDPPLSTMSVPKIEMGQEALQQMVQILSNKKKVLKKILIPVELIVRQSTKQK